MRFLDNTKANVTPLFVGAISRSTCRSANAVWETYSMCVTYVCKHAGPSEIGAGKVSRFIWARKRDNHLMAQCIDSCTLRPTILPRKARPRMRECDEQECCSAQCKILENILCVYDIENCYQNTRNTHVSISNICTHAIIKFLTDILAGREKETLNCEANKAVCPRLSETHFLHSERHACE